MSLKTKYKIFSWAVIFVAYSYLLYKIVDFVCSGQIDSLSISLSGEQSVAFMLVFLLLPLNIVIEALKWRCALLPGISISFAEAVKQTLMGFVGGWITPNKLGDLPMRVVRLKDNNNRIEGIVRGMVGSVAVVDVSLIFGVVALTFMTADEITDSRTFLILTSLAIIALQLLVIVFYHRILDFISRQKIAVRTYKGIQIQTLCEHLKQISAKQLTSLLAYSAARYLVYSLQLYLILYCFGISLSLSAAITAIPIYYMLLTLSPSLPAADIGIRGSWGIVVFSHYSENITAIALATTLLWAINNIIPMICGTIILRK